MCDKVTYEQIKEQLPGEPGEALDELAVCGAQRMLAVALEAEVAEYIDRHRDQRDENGHALVVRNGKAGQRRLATGAGVLEIRAPRVNDRREGERFTSTILPPYMRRSPRLEEALPVLYLRGLSTGDFAPALEVLLGQAAGGFSPTTITRLKGAWADEYKAWNKRDLANERWAYVWADGVTFPVRLEDDALTCLVLVGVTEDGTKEIIALENGYRESEESWLTLLRDLKRRGFHPPLLAIGDGALGFWNALEQVFPKMKQQLCWKHSVPRGRARLFVAEECL